MEIKIYDTPERVKKFLAKEDDRNKRIEYFMGIPPFSASNILVKDDGVMHYSQSTGKIMMSKNSYYIRYYDKRGFTFDGCIFFVRSDLSQVAVDQLADCGLFALAAVNKYPAVDLGFQQSGPLQCLGFGVLGEGRGGVKSTRRRYFFAGAFFAAGFLAGLSLLLGLPELVLCKKNSPPSLFYFLHPLKAYA